MLLQLAPEACTATMAIPSATVNSGVNSNGHTPLGLSSFPLIRQPQVMPTEDKCNREDTGHNHEYTK
jgi:hypothetical protein